MLEEVGETSLTAMWCPGLLRVCKASAREALGEASLVGLGEYPSIALQLIHELLKLR